MKKKQLPEEISNKDKNILRRRKKIVWTVCGLALAVLCLVIAAVVLAPEKKAPLPPPANGNWTVNYIQEKPVRAGGLDRDFEHFGSFYEDLNEQELKTILPKERPEWMSATGKSLFDRHGVLWGVEIEVSTTIPGQTVRVSFNSYPVIKELERVASEDDSVCNDVAYRVYEYPTVDGTTVLDAATVRQHFLVEFQIALSNDYLEQGKQDFKQILESFTYYGEKDKPDWSKITYEYIPESYWKNLTLEEARQDPDFGALIPQDYPQAVNHDWPVNQGNYYLVRTEVSRVKDYYENYLQVDYDDMLEGCAEVTWRISYFDETIHAKFLVHVDEEWESANSPIFYIEEMTPQTVYAIRDNSPTGRIYLMVKCGDYLVSIDANKDVDSFWVRLAVEWLYENF